MIPPIPSLLQFWDSSIVPAVALAEGWCRKHAPAKMQIEVVHLPNRTPVLFAEAPATPGTVLVYGHLDKQPEMAGWMDGLGPWTPVMTALRSGASGRV